MCWVDVLQRKTEQERLAEKGGWKPFQEGSDEARRRTQERAEISHLGGAPQAAHTAIAESQSNAWCLRKNREGTAIAGEN